MIVILMILLALLSFLIGLYFGSGKSCNIPKPKKKLNDSEIRTLIEEYKNFLSYDGTEQL